MLFENTASERENNVWRRKFFLCFSVSCTVALPTRPPALSKTSLSLRVELGLTTVIKLSLRKRTTPLGESLLAMVTLTTCREPRTAPPVAPSSRTSNISACSLRKTVSNTNCLDLNYKKWVFIEKMVR